MAVNYNHVFEVDTGPEESVSRDNGFVGKITYQCDWADRIQLMIDMLTADGGLGRIYPHQNIVNARACDASAKTAQGEELPAGAYGLGKWEHAYVTVTFKTPGRNNDQQPENTELISETLEGNAEFLTLDPSGFYWDKDRNEPVTSDQAPGRLIRGLDYCVTFQQVAQLPAALLTITDGVNDAAITSPTLKLTFPAETLRFSAPQLTRKFSLLTGAGTWTVSYRLAYRKSGWNKYWRPQTNTYEYQYIDTGGEECEIYYNYPLVSFKPLLSFA